MTHKPDAALLRRLAPTPNDASSLVRDDANQQDGGRHASTSSGSQSAEGPVRAALGAVSAVQEGFGNTFFSEAPIFAPDLGSEGMVGTEFSGLDSATAVMQQHTMGSVAMAMAGFETSQVMPGTAPNGVMRQLLRRAQAEKEGLDTGKAASRIGATSGQPLPTAVRARMEQAFGHDFSHVRVHTDGGAAEAAEALNAIAFAIGQDIYFGRGGWRPGTPAGDELLAHELTHVKQADEGRLPATSSDGMDVSSPSDPHEREAEAMGRVVAQQLSSGVADAPTVAEPQAASVSTAPQAGPEASAAPTPEASAPQANSEQATSNETSAARRRRPADATADDTTSGTEETSAEVFAEVMIAGQTIRVKLPPSDDQTATANTDLDLRPVEGLHITGATVNVDEDGAISGGTLRGELEVPGFFAGVKLALGILPGGQVAPSATDVPIKIGPATGTITLGVSEAGLTGSGEFAVADLGLPEWIGLRAGNLQVQFNNGEITGGGQLTGTQTTMGMATMEAQLNNENLNANITFTVTDGYEPVPGVVLNNTVLTGTLVRPLTADGAPDGGDAGGASPDTAPAQAPADGGAPPNGGPVDGGQAPTPARGGSPASADPGGVSADPGAPGAAGAERGGAAAAAQGRLNASPNGPNAAGPNSAGPDSAGPDNATPSTAVQPATDASTEAAGGAADPDSVFKLRGTGSVTLKDWITGEVEIAYDPSAQTYDLSGSVSGAQEMQFGEILAVRSEVSLDIQSNVATEIKAKINFKTERLVGQINADWDLQTNLLNGTANARLARNWPLEASWGSLRLLRHGRLEAKVEDNVLTEINGRVKFDAAVDSASDGPLRLEGQIEGDFDTENNTVNGTASGLVASDFVLPVGQAGGEGGASQKFTLLQGSSLRAVVEDNELAEVTLGAELRYDRDGTPFLSGALEGARYDVSVGELSGQGTFTLLQTLERSTKNDQWTLRLMEGSEVTATVAKNKLTEIGGTITVQVSDAQGLLANGTIDGAELKMDTWETSGTLKLTTVRKFRHPGEGQSLANGYGLDVLPGSGIEGTISDDVLTEVGADLRTMITDEEGSLARLRLQAEWDLENNTVDGKGSLSLARQLVVAEDLAGQGWTAKVLRGTKAEGTLEDNAFTKVDGTLKAGIDDDQGRFLDVEGTGEWTTDDDMFDIVGTVTVAREKQLAGGGDGWSISLTPETSSATATIEDDVFKGIEGTISTLVRRAGEDFASVQLGGSWNEAQGFNGEGEAELLTDLDVATIGDYQLWVVQGSGARIGVEQDTVSEIGGKVPMRLDENGTPFIKGAVEGSYAIDDKVLNGSGAAEVLVEKQLGTLGADQLWLIPSSNASVTFSDNALSEVGGEMNLSVRNDGGEYATIALSGSFDAAGGTGFTGQGGVMVTRENQLFAVDDYSFWLMPGAGANATIEQNVLKKIDGNVPFMVKDGGPSALISGAVNGEYDPVTGQLSGTGAVFLGRTLEYDLGGGISLHLLEGSGGDADVLNSQLQRLGGSLTAEIWKDGVGVVRVTADGEYNVVTNTLTRLQGTATLLQPLSLMGGDIEILNVSGSATIENNELVQAGGSGQIVIHPLNEMQGTFEVEWSNTGGNEQYSGRGWLDFTLIDTDPATGRGMSGRVFAEVTSADTFTAIGEVDYTINEVIGGKLQVSADQNWDPLLYGEFNVNTNLVDARDLFAMEGDIIPEKSQMLAYGISLFYGMAGGMKMGLDALHMNARIAIGNWKPLSAASEVPNFESTLDLSWGMAFQAKVAPYVGLGGDLGFASASMGVRGEVILNAPVTADAGGLIRGDSGGFYGELSVGVSIAPTIDLAIIPYIKAEIDGLFEFEEDLAQFDQPLGEVFSFEWGNKYVFGDQSRRESAPVQPVAVPAPTPSATKTEGRPNVGMGGGGGSGGGKRGAPQIESGSEVAGNQSLGGSGGEMAEVMETVQDVTAIMEGLGAAGELMGMLLGALTALATFGPPGLVVYIVWNIFTGKLSWDNIKTAVVRVVDAIAAAGRLLRKYLPGWFNTIVDVFNGEKPGLLDALFGADDKMRESVARGDHIVAPYEMHVEMVNTMKGGWLSDDDATAIAQVFEVSAGRGELSRLLGATGGANEFIDGWTTGFDDTAIKRVFDRSGIDYDD